MRCLAIPLSVITLIAASQAAGPPPKAAPGRIADAPGRIADIRAGAFSRSLPPELRFSDALSLDGDEEKLAKALAAKEPEGRLVAARALWHGRSRRHASKVLKYLADPPPGGQGYRDFQRKVDASFQPKSILRELSGGDYRWGAWLAFLRPHEDLVPVLLAGLKDKPEMLPETMLALGNSGDPRVIEPLRGLLGSKDYQTAGDAARALGYLGRADVEPELIDALAADNGWLQVQACGALAKMGTRRALPALEKLAKDARYTGALNIKGMARFAADSIKKREKP